MLGIVIVSHSARLADGVVELVRMMAADVPVVAAGGLEDGTLGTSYEKIVDAVNAVCGEQGAIILADMGSALLTSEMVMEAMPDRPLHLAECPLVEGAMVAAMAAVSGKDMAGALADLAAPDAFNKR